MWYSVIVPSTNVRISKHSIEALRDLAKARSVSMQEILDQAIEAYQRQKYLEDVNTAYAALRDNPRAWAEEQEERSAWDLTLADGLDRE
jgi:Asp-tRNA(Asn)/Glu-tRNA(Gln) amidotransferase A subunit family amidase